LLDQRCSRSDNQAPYLTELGKKNFSEKIKQPREPYTKREELGQAPFYFYVVQDPAISTVTKCRYTVDSLLLGTQFYNTIKRFMRHYCNKTLIIVFKLENKGDAP